MRIQRCFRRGDALNRTGPRGAEQVFPALEGLPKALEAPTASFLDVGTGVGRVAIAMCQVPVMFLPADVAAGGLRRIRAVLRPGGWAVLGSLAAEGEGCSPRSCG